MPSRAPRLTLLTLLAASLLASGCDTTSVEPPPQPAQPSAESFEKFGNYELHFNVIRTDQLTPEIASRHGIERSAKRVLLNVALLHREAEGVAAKPVEAAVTASSRTLTGPLQDVAIRRITEAASISYVGEVAIAGNSVLVFDIKATPVGESQPFAATFQREFFTE